jgi:RNA polymerase-binding transcription factor DksA
MSFPTYISISELQISTWWFFLTISFFTSAYVFWREGIREGFDELKLFDLVFLSLIISFLVLRADILLAISLVILAVYGVAVFWRWSTFRILDIFSLSAVAGLVPLFVGAAFITANFYMIGVAGPAYLLYKFLSKTRNSRFKSGYIFSFTLLLVVFVSAFFYGEIRHLLFYVFLFSISLLNLYLRERKSMIKPKLSLGFLKDIKDKLRKKEKRLEAEQKLLMQEDPYMQPGRDQENSEFTDDAILEDVQKEVTDLRRFSVSGMLRQVRKALARLNIGTYGTCEVCGSPIDKARLEAFPEASTCIDHAVREN